MSNMAAILDFRPIRPYTNGHQLKSKYHTNLFHKPQNFTAVACFGTMGSFLKSFRILLMTS